jgi:uncharacterized protein (TIGR02145 family)
MKRFLLVFLALNLTYFANAQQVGTFKDSRDGKTYKTVKIGTQTWMAENLAFKPTSGNYWAYENNQNNVAKYGYLYNWQTAKGICPTGWHLPSDEEWFQLSVFLGDNDADKLKSLKDWGGEHLGTNEFGFTTIPAGIRYEDGSFDDLGYETYMWTSTEISSTEAWFRGVYCFGSKVHRSNKNKQIGISVRCIK